MKIKDAIVLVIFGSLLTYCAGKEWGRNIAVIILIGYFCIVGLLMEIYYRIVKILQVLEQLALKRKSLNGIYKESP